MLGAERALARSVTSIRVGTIALLGDRLFFWVRSRPGVIRELHSDAAPQTGGDRSRMRTINGSRRRWLYLTPLRYKRVSRCAAYSGQAHLRFSVAALRDSRAALKSAGLPDVCWNAGGALQRISSLSHTSACSSLWFDMPNAQDEPCGCLAQSVR